MLEPLFCGIDFNAYQWGNQDKWEQNLDTDISHLNKRNAIQPTILQRKKGLKLMPDTF